MNLKNALKQAANTEKPVRKSEKEWPIHGGIKRMVPCVRSQGMIMGFLLISYEDSIRLNVLKQFISIECYTCVYL